jgi:photoactive yellow protein
VTDVYALSAAEADRLPFGVMELSSDGVVRSYNLAEARMAGLDAGDVIGRHFFREVAPCTRESEVEGHFRELVDAGGGEADLTFVFRFRTGHRLVRIRMLVDAARDSHLLLVHDLDAA